MTVIPFPIKAARGFQKRGSSMIVKNGAIYLMWDMGTGKTLTCILAIKKLGIPVLVLAPVNAALITWPDELTKWAPELSYIVLHGKNKEQYARTAHNYDVTIINFDGLLWFYEMVNKKILKLRKFFVIWDEASMLKDHTTKRWQIMAEAMPIYSSYRVCLSGTPVPNKMYDLWSQYYLLDEGKRLGQSYYSFRDRYFDYTGAPRYKTTIKQGADEIIMDRIADITDVMDESDNLELPEVVHNNVYLELTPKLRKLYEEFEAEFMLDFPEGFTVANSSAVLNSKLRQFSQGAVYLERPEGVPRGTPKEYRVLHDIKVKALKSMVDTACGNPILAPIQFRFEKAMIDKEMRYDVPTISGATPARELQRRVREWNEGKLPLMLVHPRSVAFSLNLQFGGHTITWFALPWEMDLYEQLPRRLRRRGQTNRVIVNRFIFKNTIDEVVAEALQTKSLTQQKLFKGIKQRRQDRR